MRYSTPYGWWKERFNNENLRVEERIEAANALLLLGSRGAIAFLLQDGLFSRDIVMADEILDIWTQDSQNKQRVINYCMSELNHNLKKIKNKSRLLRSIQILGKIRYLGVFEILNLYAKNSDPQISSISRQVLENMGFTPRAAAPINPTIIKSRDIQLPTIVPANRVISSLLVLQAI